MTGDPRAARADGAREGLSSTRGRRIRGHLAQSRQSKGRQGLPFDLLRDIKRLNDDLVAGPAYPVLEAWGALLAIRISDRSC